MRRKHATVSIRVSPKTHAALSRAARKLGHPHTMGSVADEAVEFALSADGTVMSGALAELAGLD
jgi:hypothetical protein